ncbi:M949_RS01915 family surface polysaccharide biosynthesis protein [Flavobacterium sp. C3NV]|uniref:M949_RS01915 family surface polysaccharide biosynthesis protein n=1 Tax=Flavobacterium sp. C3NV TaxID=3393358 RepID=UPI0039901D24
MKNIAVLCLLLITFSSCKSDKKDYQEESQTSTSTEAKDFSLVVNKIDSTQFPASIKYEGFIKNAVRWKDKSGDNIVITTETGIYRNEQLKHEFEDSSDAELYAYHFILSNNLATQTWRVKDFIADCPVDITASFVKKTFKITDLNKNGIAEVWLMYKTVCHGDVSPSNMKIIMYEGNNKYAMRGENKVQVGSDVNDKASFIGGEYKLDANFKNGPKVFREYAQNLWKENLMEKWDN